MQVTIVGGGSYQWTPELLADLMGTPSLHGAHLVLEDIDPAPLVKMEALARRLDAALDAGTTTSRALVEDSLARIADPGGEGARRGATKSASAGQYASHWKQVWQSSCRAMTGAPSSLASKTFVGQTRTQMLQPVQRESLMISITRRASRRQLLPYRLGSTRRRVPR